jgi:hypothetical protein
MDIHKVINRHFRRSGDGVQAAGDVNAVISANVGERRSASQTSSRQRSRIVQRSGQTVVSETNREEQT